MTPHSPRYVIVTAVRDEQKFLPLTIESVLGQSIRPVEWVIVDDGSKDGTSEVIHRAAQRHPWIHGVRRDDRGYRKPGAGIIEAFYSGFNTLQCTDWEFMTKLDGDISFPSDYFEKLLGRFREVPQLGIAGGTLYHIAGGKLELETCPSFHVRGGVKTFSRGCWDALGGLWVGCGSDTIDEVQANMLGWSTKSLPELLMHHHRFTGASFGRWGALVKDGKGDYASGYHPLFMLAKCVRRLPRHPALLGSAGLMYGFLTSYLHRLPRVDAPLRRYVRSQQLALLTGRPTIWK